MGEVEQLVFKNHKREVRLIADHDSLLNNTTRPLVLQDAFGKQIAEIEPGGIYAPGRPMTVFFTADAKINFRSYVNEEPDNATSAD